MLSALQESKGGFWGTLAWSVMTSELESGMPSHSSGLILSRPSVLVRSPVQDGSGRFGTGQDDPLAKESLLACVSKGNGSAWNGSATERVNACDPQDGPQGS